MDERLKTLSHSYRLELHSCPRKFQLNRLRAKQESPDPTAAINQNITFAFGHVVGEGIQYVLEGLPLEECIWKMFLGWHADLEDRNEKQNKSFYMAVAAIQKFHHIRSHGFLDDFELAEFNGRKAIELSFQIHLPDGFIMRGSCDAVLRNKNTGEVLVLECKTSSASNVNPAEWKNASQGLGYSVVLDHVFPDITSYKVMYLIYGTKSMDFTPLPFVKSYLQRAQWIQELLLDVEMIKLYENTGVYPMHGESCYSWYRECEYLNTCTLSTKYLVPDMGSGSYVEQNSTYNKPYDVVITLVDLITSQLDKNTKAEEKHQKIAALPGVELGDEIL